MSQLRLTGVHKRFGDVVALDGLEISVSEGEFFCLFGPSAAGKITALRVIAGLERADAGRVEFDGAAVTAAPVQGRDMAMIFQTFALYPHLSVHDNLAYPLREARLERTEVEARVRSTAEMLRIEHTLARRPATLSGGEQQRLAIGRALIRRPRLLLLDEPLTNLDAKLRHDTRAEFKRLHRELGMTMVYATPDQLEALTMGERVAVIREGRVTQVDTPRRLYAAPGDRHVAALVGAPQMNLVPATVRREARETRVELAFAQLDASRWSESLSDGDRVILGIRPQDLSPARDAAGPTFEASVRLTEPLGDITVIDLDARGTPVKMVLREDEALTYRVGDRLRVAIAADQTHLFFEETGVRVA